MEPDVITFNRDKHWQTQKRSGFDGKNRRGGMLPVLSPVIFFLKTFLLGVLYC